MIAEDDYHVFYRFKDCIHNVIGKQSVYTSKDMMDGLEKDFGDKVKDEFPYLFRKSLIE